MKTQFLTIVLALSFMNLGLAESKTYSGKDEIRKIVKRYNKYLKVVHEGDVFSCNTKMNDKMSEEKQLFSSKNFDLISSIFNPKEITKVVIEEHGEPFMIIHSDATLKTPDHYQAKSVFKFYSSNDDMGILKFTSSEFQSGSVLKAVGNIRDPRVVKGNGVKLVTANIECKI